MLKTLPNPTRGLGLFLAAVLFQTVLLLIAPAQQQYVLITGEEVTLKTAPVDPYDPLRGYYVTLGYDISRPDKLPGYPQAVTSGQTLYVVLKKPSTAKTAWTPERVSVLKPELGPGLVAIRGKVEAGRLVYGLETYYIPEAKREEIDQKLRTRTESALVDVKIDSAGQAVPVRLRVAGQVYEF